MASTNDALRKRVETVLDMALSTVSSLTESFISGATTSGDQGGAPNQDANKTSSEIPVDAQAMDMDTVSTTKKGNGAAADEGGSDLTEQSDEDDGMLQVHD